MTVLTRHAIYQSADFRLTSWPGNRPIEDPSPKLVSLQYFTGTGFVTYMGVGMWRDRPISDWVVSWLADGEIRSMSETAAVLESEGTRLLNDVKRRARQSIPHTFTLAGFEGGTAAAYVISNCEDCYGNSWFVQTALSTTRRRVRRKGAAAVIVTGAPSAVPVQERRILAKLAALRPDDGGSIRRRMESLNSAAAQSAKSKGLVSVECAVNSLRSDGYGVLQLDDTAQNRPLDIPKVTNGIDMNAFIADAL